MSQENREILVEDYKVLNNYILYQATLKDEKVLKAYFHWENLIAIHL